MNTVEKIATLIVGLAIVAVIFKSKNSASVLNAGVGGFANAINAARKG